MDPLGAGALLAGVLFACVGLGTLVTNQVAALVIVIAFTQFVEPILRVAASLSDITANIGKFLPGEPNVVAQNMPGAGGIRAANFLYSAAPKDGTVIAMLDQAVHRVQQVDRV